jgi:hypothetical protein
MTSLLRINKNPEFFAEKAFFVRVSRTLNKTMLVRQSWIFFQKDERLLLLLFYIGHRRIIFFLSFLLVGTSNLMTIK